MRCSAPCDGGSFDKGEYSTELVFMPGLAPGTMGVSQHIGPLTVGDHFSNNARLLGPSENSLHHPSCCSWKAAYGPGLVGGCWLALVSSYFSNNSYLFWLRQGGQMTAKIIPT